MDFARLNQENLRASALFARLLSVGDALFEPEEIEVFCRDCGIEKREGLMMLLGAACGLKADESAADRRLIERYFFPALRLCDPKQYRLNPYYARIMFPEAQRGKWRMTRLAYQPFQVFPRGHMMLLPDGREIQPLGYFDEAFSYPAVLEKDREWMTVTPNEIETMEEDIGLCRGNAAVFGLGLGYFAYMASEKEDVRSVTVIERDPDAIAMFRDMLLPQFREKKKIRLIQADAYDYLHRDFSREGYDYAFLDLWHDVSDGLGQYIRLLKNEKNHPGTVFRYWIEQDMLIFLRGLIIEDWLSRAGKLDALLREDMTPQTLSLQDVRRFALEMTPEDIR